MLAGLFPSWLDVTAARSIAAGGGMVFVFGGIMGVALARTIARRLLMLGLLLALAGGAFYYRATLADCAKTCDCSLFGHRLDAPGCAAALPS